MLIAIFRDILRTFLQPGTAFALVLAIGRDTERLAEVLLVQSADGGYGARPVVARDEQELAVAHAPWGGHDGVDPESPSDLGRQCLVEHGLGEGLDRCLQDVRRGGPTLGQADPAVLCDDDRELVLHAGEREPELAVLVGE